MTGPNATAASTELAAVAAGVRLGVTQVREQFIGHPMTVTEDGAGGAFVVVEQLDVGPVYTTTTTWLGFHLSAAYPAADVYPHYVGPLVRVDGQPHPAAMQPHTWRSRSGWQVSRRSNRWNPALDTAALKAEKVLAWLAAQ